MVRICDPIHDGCSRGWAFTPLNGKMPVLKAWQKQPKASYAEAMNYASKGNVGLRTGEISGISVVDIEEPFVKTGARFPVTPTVLTGSGGVHLYYLHVPGVKNQCRSLIDPDTGQQVDGVDVRGDGGQVVFPGSIHPKTGKAYKWTSRNPKTIAFAPFPTDWLPKEQSKPRPTGRKILDHSDKRVKAYLDVAIPAIQKNIAESLEGTRNNNLRAGSYRLGTMAGAGWISKQEAIDISVSAGLLCGLPSWECELTANNGVRDGMLEPIVLADRERSLNEVKAW